MDVLMPDTLADTESAVHSSHLQKNLTITSTPPSAPHLRPPAPDLIQAFPLWTPAGAHRLIALCTIKQTWTS